jgi:predicted SAM-dependent methyltransferase
LIDVAAPPTLKRRVGQWLFPRLPITRFLFDQLRFEVNGLKTRAAYTLLPWRRRQLSSLRALNDQLVNVACGPHVVNGFINIDLLPCDASVVEWDCRRSIPLGDGCAAGVRVEQFVEHLETREELPAFLADVHRALRPGGVLRIIVPDGERYLRAYCRADLDGFRELATPDPFPEDLPTRMDVINHVFHQWHEHRWAYDFETLTHRLRAAGFARIERTSYLESLDPRLACDRPTHAPYSLYVDAVK